jgi:hypothetical protein
MTVFVINAPPFVRRVIPAECTPVGYFQFGPAPASLLREGDRVRVRSRGEFDNAFIGKGQMVMMLRCGRIFRQT